MKAILIAALLTGTHGYSREIQEIKSGIGAEYSPSGKGFKAPSSAVNKYILARSIIYIQGKRWPDPTKISHCWINPEQGTPDMIFDLQQHASAEYARAAVGFVWEGKCTQNSRPNQVRTYLYPVYEWKNDGEIYAGGGLSWLGPVNAPLGTAADEGIGTMNIQVAKDIKGYPVNGYRSWVQDVVRATFVHELGHAVGLAHEQERADSPVCGDQKGDLKNGTVYLFVGKYDPKSIMNYCRDPSNISSLSEGDIAGIQSLYPPKPIVTPPIVTTTAPAGGKVVGNYKIKPYYISKCLDVPGGMKTDYTGLQLWACNGNSWQNFSMIDRLNGFYQFKNIATGKCLDILGGSSANGTRVVQAQCSDLALQQFKLRDTGNFIYEIQSRSLGKCFEIANAATADGAFLQINQCGSQNSQRFGFYPAGQAGAMRPVSTTSPAL